MIYKDIGNLYRLFLYDNNNEILISNNALIFKNLLNLDLGEEKKFGGHKIQPLEGVSLKLAFNGKTLGRTDALYFDHHLNGAIRDGQWKLVRYGDSGRNAKLHPWQLYDMENDRSEQNDLAKKYPDKVKALADKWEKWAVRARVKPWPWKVK